MKKIFVGALAMFALFMTSAVTKSYAADTEVKSVIVMVGDGMGLAAVSHTDNVCDTALFIERVKSIGLVHTHSHSSKVTDSAAAATAFACGVKSNNGVLGLDHNLERVESILERAEKSGRATGLVATYAITHATPAGYYAHNEDRDNAEAIADDMIKSGVDLFIGGGRKYFESRGDSRNLTSELTQRGYNVVYDMEGVEAHSDGRLAAMLAENGLPAMMKGRGDMLPKSTDKALEILSKLGGENGFFVMVEGSQIDGMGHRNSADGIAAETLDFSKAVEEAFDFADENPGTLVVVFADHETGGLTLPGKDADIEPTFSTNHHTGVMVPIYAYGAGAEAFTGVMDNTDIPKRIASLMAIEW